MRFSKKYIIIVAISVIILGGYLIYNSYINLTRGLDPVHHLSNECKLIESSLLAYMIDTKDIEFKNLGVVSGVTNSEFLLLKLKEPINNEQYLRNDINTSIDKYGYKGFKVEVYKSRINVKVSPQKKTSECVVIIND